MKKIIEKNESVDREFNISGLCSAFGRIFSTKSKDNVKACSDNCKCHMKSVEFAGWTWSYMKIFENLPPSGIAVKCRSCGKIEYYNNPNTRTASSGSEIMNYYRWTY